jgi:hypothetical protein
MAIDIKKSQRTSLSISSASDVITRTWRRIQIFGFDEQKQNVHQLFGLVVQYIHSRGNPDKGESLIVAKTHLPKYPIAERDCTFRRLLHTDVPGNSHQEQISQWLVKFKTIVENGIFNASVLHKKQKIAIL